jgi:hypothetical protein
MKHCIIDHGNETIRVQDVYKVSEDSDTIMTVNYGQWGPKRNMSLLEENIWNRRSDFKGQTIR